MERSGTRRALLVLGALALGACSQGEDPSALFDGGAPGTVGVGPGAGGVGGALDPNGTVIGPDGRVIAVSSTEYLTEIIGDRVFFLVDQSTLTPDARTTLDNQAQWLLTQPGAQIQIEGHADEQGTREYNFRLSARRASAVRDYLVTRGVPDRQLSTIPFGKERPVAVCSDETCWARNRRAVTVVTGGLGA